MTVNSFLSENSQNGITQLQPPVQDTCCIEYSRLIGPNTTILQSKRNRGKDRNALLSVSDGDHYESHIRNLLLIPVVKRKAHEEIASNTYTSRNRTDVLSMGDI